MRRKRFFPCTNRKKAKASRGETLMALLVTTAIGGAVLAATLSSFMTSTRTLWDRITISEAQTQARDIATLLASDFRMIGSGMPIGNANFSMTDATLGDAPLPILTNATAQSITYRFNKQGKWTVLSAPFTPSSGATLSVLSTNDLVGGDTVYLSNISSEYSENPQHGAKAVVSSASGTTVTLNSNSIVASQGVTFAPGTLVERVTSVTLNCASPQGITRNPETGSVILQARTSCSLEYLDANGTALPLPLTASVIQSTLSSIRVTVNVAGRRRLSNKSTFTATATEVAALRNLSLGRTQ